MITFIIFATIFALFFVYYNAVKKHYDSQKQEVSVKQQEPEIDWQRKIQNVSQLAEALVQADIVGDHLTADRIKRNDYDGPLPERRDDGGWLSIYDNLRILKIVGINHRQGIGRYVGRVECALMPEPDNEYDHNAIKIIAEDGHHLGYIQKERTEMVRWMTADEFPYHCTAFIKEHEDEIDGHKFFTGHVYIKLLD